MEHIITFDYFFNRLNLFYLGFNKDISDLVFNFDLSFENDLLNISYNKLLIENIVFEKKNFLEEIKKEKLSFCENDQDIQKIQNINIILKNNEFILFKINTLVKKAQFNQMDNFKKKLTELKFSNDFIIFVFLLFFKIANFVKENGISGGFIQEDTTLEIINETIKNTNYLKTEINSGNLKNTKLEELFNKIKENKDLFEEKISIDEKKELEKLFNKKEKDENLSENQISKKKKDNPKNQKPENKSNNKFKIFIFFLIILLFLIIYKMKYLFFL